MFNVSLTLCGGFLALYMTTMFSTLKFAVQIKEDTLTHTLLKDTQKEK